MRSTNNGSSSDVSDSVDPEMQHVIDELESAIRWLRVAAIAVFVVGAAILGFVAVELPQLTENASERIQEAGDSTNVMLFELLRGAAFAAAITSILFGVLTLGRACLDQATRFQKRLIAAHFLNYVMHSYEAELRSGAMSLTDAVNFLKSWSENVESAFSSVKFGSRSQRTDVRLGGASAGTSTGSEKAAAETP